MGQKLVVAVGIVNTAVSTQRLTYLAQPPKIGNGYTKDSSCSPAGLIGCRGLQTSLGVGCQKPTRESASFVYVFGGRGQSFLI
jgi:hypothetical protein